MIDLLNPSSLSGSSLVSLFVLQLMAWGQLVIKRRGGEGEEGGWGGKGRRRMVVVAVKGRYGKERYKE